MRQNAKMWLFVATVIIVPITVFGIVQLYEQRFKTLPVLGPENHTVGTFSFKDQYGKTVDLTTWKNKNVVACFFFTHCPIICPKMIYQLKRVQAYGDQETIIACFTVDPEHDSVGRMKQYAEKLGIEGNWQLLTGDKKDLYRFARKELYIVATDGDGGPEDFIHSDNLAIIDKQHRIRGFYKGTDEIEVNKLIHDIDKLK